MPDSKACIFIKIEPSANCFMVLLRNDFGGLNRCGRMYISEAKPTFSKPGEKIALVIGLISKKNRMFVYTNEHLFFCPTLTPNISYASTRKRNCS